MSVSPAQIKMVHVLKGALKMDDETYRAMLAGYNGAASSKDLTFEQAKDLIDRMEVNAVNAGLWEKKPGQTHSAMINRPGYATWQQIKKIYALWNSVSRQPDAASRKKALNTFLSNHFGISFVDWLPSEMVGKVIRTLEAMRAQEQKKGKAA
jgi:phage gp16-like protein